MTEQPAEPAQQLSDYLEDLPCVTLPAIPTVYGLEDAEEGVISWVVALPDGRAYIFSREGGAGLIHTDLEQVVDWWAPWEGVDLVLVTGAPAGGAGS